MQFHRQASTLNLRLLNCWARSLLGQSDRCRSGVGWGVGGGVEFKNLKTKPNRERGGVQDASGVVLCLVMINFSFTAWLGWRGLVENSSGFAIQEGGRREVADFLEETGPRAL